MLKMIITEAVVSKGYNNDPAIRYFDIENSGQAANFRIGKRIYDGRAENKHRWLNFTVKAHQAHEAQGGLVHQHRRPL